MIEVHILGIMQDGGLPQAGCTCTRCRDAAAGERPPGYVASLGVLDRQAQRWFLVDATPDLRWQVAHMQRLAPDVPMSGILLTHAHMGHYTGLLHLGLEGWNTHHLPVYGDERLADLLRRHAPWSQLFAQGNLVMHVLRPFQLLQLSATLTVTPIPVPHRDEWSGTFAFRLQSPHRTLFYCPDTDRWDGWQPPLETHLHQADIALLDGTFFQPSEIPHRAPEAIPHPFIAASLDRLQPFAPRIRFIHLNHTNPLLDDGPLRAQVEARGFRIARHGEVIRMSP